jgi:hypothetical protein
MSGDARSEWIERVLGVRVPTSGDVAEGAGLRAAAAAWRGASDAVDGQIAKLQAVLRDSDDDELREIAEYGLNGVTGGFKVPLMAALQDAEKGDQRGLTSLRAIIAAFSAHLERDTRIAACDDNPFGIPVAIRATLGPALAQLARSLPA